MNRQLKPLLAIFLTIAIALVTASIDTSIAQKSELTRLSGIQPDFAHVIGGLRFGKQIAFANNSGQRCVLSTDLSEKLRERILSSYQLVVDCNIRAYPAQAYQVEADGITLVDYVDTVRSLSFENGAKVTFLVGLFFLLIWQIRRYVKCL
jgi:hypothetical protein